MDSGRSDIAVNLSDTENPSLQNLNISWSEYHNIVYSKTMYWKFITGTICIFCYSYFTSNVFLQCLLCGYFMYQIYSFLSIHYSSECHLCLLLVVKKRCLVIAFEKPCWFELKQHWLIPKEELYKKNRMSSFRLK